MPTGIVAVTETDPAGGETLKNDILALAIVERKKTLTKYTSTASS